MDDRVTEITIMIFFSAIGVMILVLGWIRPLDGFERAMISVIGGAGIVGALVRLRLTRNQRRAASIAAEASEDRRR